MFVIELIYKAPLAQIDARMGAHVKFPNKHYTPPCVCDSD
jgi:hypothetical protein